MAKYIKKPVSIDACQLPKDGQSASEFMAWSDLVAFERYTSERDGSMEIDTLEGSITASPGDYIIKGIAGEFYPCKPEIFEAKYYTESEYAKL